MWDKIKLLSLEDRIKLLGSIALKSISDSYGFQKISVNEHSEIDEIESQLSKLEQDEKEDTEKLFELISAILDDIKKLEE